MSLDISQLIEFEERMERIDFVRNGHYKPGNKSLDEPDFFTMHSWGTFDETDDENEAQDALDSNANEITMGEEAGTTVATLPEATHSPVVVEEEAGNTFATLPEAIDSLVVVKEGDINTLAALPEAADSPVVIEEEVDWAAYLFEEGDINTPSALPEAADFPAVIEEEVDWAAYLFEEGEEAPVAERQDSFHDQNISVTGQIDSSTTLMASPLHSTPKFDTGLSLESPDEHMITDKDFQDALKMLGCQADERSSAPTQLPKPRRHFKDFPKYLPQKALEGDIQSPVQQVQQPIHLVNHTTHGIEKQVSQVEAGHQAEYDMQQVQPTQQAHLLHMEEYRVRPVDVFQPVIEQAVPHMQSQVSPDTISDIQVYSGLEVMDGVLADELNEHSYIVPEEHSEHGLAGLFGLTLDQATSGMKNKKIGVRNTVIEKPKPTESHSLLQYAGVKKSKSPKAKVTASNNRVQTREQKGPQTPTVHLTGQQIINKPDVATPANKIVPPYMTKEQLLTIMQVANDRTRPLWHQAVQEGIRSWQQQQITLMDHQAASASFGQQALYTSLDQSVQLNPYHLPQQAPQTLQVEHTDQNSAYPQQQRVGQEIDYASLMSGNHTASDNLQQHRAHLTPGRSPIQGNQGFTYSTPQGAQMDPFYYAAQGSQGASYPSPQITPQQVGPAASCGSPNNPSQSVGQQFLSAHHTAAFNIPQQSTQMGVYADPQQAWQFTQQGQQVQPQVYYPPLQQAQQPARYYAPIPAAQPNGHFPQYDPQNHAQIVAQQHRMQQEQIQINRTQQFGTQYQPTMQDNLNYSAKMAAQANAGKTKRQFTVEDFVKERH